MRKRNLYNPIPHKKYIINGMVVDTYYYNIPKSERPISDKKTPSKTNIVNADTKGEGIYHPSCKIPKIYIQINISENEIRIGANRILYDYKKDDYKKIEKLSPYFLVGIITCQYHSLFYRLQTDYYDNYNGFYRIVDHNHINAARYTIRALRKLLDILSKFKLRTKSDYGKIIDDLESYFGSLKQIEGFYKEFENNNNSPHNDIDRERVKDLYSRYTDLLRLGENIVSYDEGVYKTPESVKRPRSAILPRSPTSPRKLFSFGKKNVNDKVRSNKLRSKMVIGSKSQVYKGTAEKTKGGLTKKDIIRVKDKYGNIRYKSKDQRKTGRKKSTFRAKWTKAMKQARKELMREGVIEPGMFVPVGGSTAAGRALHKRIKELIH